MLLFVRNDVLYEIYRLVGKKIDFIIPVVMRAREPFIGISERLKDVCLRHQSAGYLTRLDHKNKGDRKGVLDR
jgi:hypothetical protein